MISILICDDHAVVRYGIAAVLESYGQFRLVGAVSDAQQALAVIARDPPDVVLMDLLMPGINGIAATRAIRASGARSRIMLLTSHEGDDYLLEALQAGASSYLLKDTPPQELVTAIERTAMGESVLHPRIAGAMVRILTKPRAPDGAAMPLTEREIDVLRLIAEGLSNTEISQQLAIALKTAKNHVSNILEKLQLSDRTQAAVYAWREGIVRRP